MSRSKPTCPVLTAPPELRATGSENQPDNIPRGKRGAAMNEPAAGSPRAVRARHQDGKREAPWAIARRCAYVERRKVGNWREQQQQHQLVDSAPQDTSWDETAIELPIGLRSVGSAIEPSEAALLREHASLGNWPRGGDPTYAHGPREVDENMGAPQDPCYQDQTRLMNRGVATPVRNRNQRSAGVQTNRESIMRHHRENGGSPGASDEEQNTVLVPGRRALQDATSMMNSERAVGNSKGHPTDNTSVFSAGRLFLKEMSYPSHDQGLHFSVQARDTLEEAKATAFSSPVEGQAALAQVLKTAIKDECEHLDRFWGTTDKGGNRAEDRVSLALKKIISRVEKAHLAQMVPATGEQATANSEDRCAQLERELAAANQRIASLRQAVEQPSGTQDVHRTLADLSDRLRALTCGPEGISVPRMAEFEDKLDQAHQGIVVANACARHMFLQLQEEKKALQERSSQLSPGTASSQVPSGPIVGLQVLRGLP